MCAGNARVLLQSLYFIYPFSLTQFSYKLLWHNLFAFFSLQSRRLVHCYRDFTTCAWVSSPSPKEKVHYLRSVRRKRKLFVAPSGRASFRSRFLPGLNAVTKRCCLCFRGHSIDSSKLYFSHKWMNFPHHSATKSFSGKTS